MPFGDLLPFLEPAIPHWALHLQPHARWKYHACLGDRAHCVRYTGSCGAPPACRHGAPDAGGYLFCELPEGPSSSSLRSVAICSIWCQFWDVAGGPDGTVTLGVIMCVGMRRAMLLVESSSRSERGAGSGDGQQLEGFCLQPRALCPGGGTDGGGPRPCPACGVGAFGCIASHITQLLGSSCKSLLRSWGMRV